MDLKAGLANSKTADLLELGCSLKINRNPVFLVCFERISSIPKRLRKIDEISAVASPTFALPPPLSNIKTFRKGAFFLN
jgi:hypothetical protein